MNIFDCVLVGVGGFAGAICRFGIAELSRFALGPTFPLGTLIANLTGCFLIGLLIGSGRAELNHHLKLSFGVGFLGALTTFSTFSAETISQAQTGGVSSAMLNVGANLIGGLLAVIVGIYLGQRFGVKVA
jgi:CrcB protein